MQTGEDVSGCFCQRAKSNQDENKKLVRMMKETQSRIPRKGWWVLKDFKALTVSKWKEMD